ncbi:baseplate J family protein [Yersinia enterocolitica]|uniref:baseplate J/gp47 family protein n=1 Tax=Yersinia enterocolitica TaxID=630 RepID=UPI0005E8B6B2|nr:baseplate J/gp47 family protein [Yersinia enterocolitica]CQJ19638.1 baseplate J family protein [Yersinia enterocolitica]
MHRIDTPTAQVDKFGSGKNGFTRGNPQTGVPATALDDDYFDAVQEELAGVVEAAGLTLKKTDRAQVLASIKLLIGSETNTKYLKVASNLQPINGLPSSAAADSIEGGTDVEPVDEWRARVIERWYYTPQGGSDPDYIIWAKEVPGVTRAWTYRHWMGTGTVGVMVANSNLENPIPDNAVVGAVRDHILPLAPVAGASLYILAPVAKVVPFHIRLTPDTPEVRYAVIAELRAMFLRDGVPGGTLDHSRISEAISIATGEYKHVLVSPTDDIPLAATELPIVGELTWT